MPGLESISLEPTKIKNYNPDLTSFSVFDITAYTLTFCPIKIIAYQTQVCFEKQTKIFQYSPPLFFG